MENAVARAHAGEIVKKETKLVTFAVWPVRLEWLINFVGRIANMIACENPPSLVTNNLQLHVQRELRFRLSFY